MSLFPDQLEVNVTQEDINQGIRKSATRCPIANSLMRAFNINKNYEDVIVLTQGEDYFGPYSVKIYKLGEQGWYLHSKESSKFIADFDEGSTVVPSNFVLTKVKRR